MGTESVNAVSETLNTVPSRVLKPVLGNSIGRPTGLTLGQMAASAAANDPVEWSAAATTIGETAGTVLASAEELLVIDLALSDPLNAELIAQLSPGEVSASSEFSQQLIERYGQRRFAQMKHLQEAHERARDQFRDALNVARAQPPGVPVPNYTIEYVGQAPPLPANTPPGWRMEAVDRYESGGEAGALYRGTEFQWRFDSAEFAHWYGQQPGISHQVFREMYGQGAVEILPPPSTSAANEYGGAQHPILLLDNGAWVFDLQDSYLRPSAQVAAVHSEETEVRNAGAIQFDPQLGLSTAISNLNAGRDWFDGAFDVAVSAIIAYLSYQTGGAIAGAAQSYVGAAGSAGAAIAAGAASGAAGAALNGLAHDQFDWKALFRAALSGGLGAGISQLPVGQGAETLANLGYSELAFGEYTVDWSLRAGSMAGQATLRGLLTDALGGKFNDGAKQAALQFVAQEFTREFGEYLKVNQMSGGEAAGLKYLSQITASAIRVAGHSGNPMQPIAQSWLEGILNEAGAGGTAGAAAARAAGGTAGEAAGRTAGEVAYGSTEAPVGGVVVQLATVAPVPNGRRFDVQPIEIRPVDLQPSEVNTRAESSAQPDIEAVPAVVTAPPIPSAPSDTAADLPSSTLGIETFAASTSASPPSFAGELDAWNPSGNDDQTQSYDEPTLLARAGTFDSSPGYQGGTPFGRRTTRVPIPRLDPVTGLPLERVTTGSNMMPTNEWRPMPSQSEAELAALIDKQSRSNQVLTPLEQGRLDAANWVKLERAQAGGASEGNGYATDANGNIRTFELDRNNRVLLRIDERVEPSFSYRNGNGDIVYVSRIDQIPTGINPNSVVTGRALYYRDQLIARDFAVPQAYADAVSAQGASGGDPVSSLRRQVAVSPTGPFSELANFIDKGSGQVNPLDWDAFKARALDLAAASRQQVGFVLTSNGMLNTYQQANANATGLANLTPNAIVVNVLNPSTGFSALDVADVIATHLGAQQTVAAALIEQIREARGFQDAVAQRLSKDGAEVAPQNILLVAHSQGTVNANQALEQLVDIHKEQIANINAMYVGTAVNRVPIGLANLSNVTDLADAVSTRHTRGIEAITKTFLVGSTVYDELSFPSTPDTEAVGQIPDSYRQLTTNFNAEPRASLDTANSVETALPTGNNHSLYLYLARPDVQRELARLLNVNTLNRNNRPIIPTYTGIPDDRPGG